MDKPERIINLKKEKSFIEQYITLRNKYSDLLLTHPIDLKGTQEWLKNRGAEIRCIVRGNILLGTVILYLEKKGEIAFFARYRRKGIGGRLLDAVERVARRKKINGVWAWVLSDNSAAQRAFLKKGYIPGGSSRRIFKGKIEKGLIFRKNLSGR